MSTSAPFTPTSCSVGRSGAFGWRLPLPTARPLSLPDFTNGVAMCIGMNITLIWPPSVSVRSEEHTSELQSLRHLVCRLLLEKKKKIRTINPATQIQTLATLTHWTPYPPKPPHTSPHPRNLPTDHSTTTPTPHNLLRKLQRLP